MSLLRLLDSAFQIERQLSKPPAAHSPGEAILVEKAEKP